MLAREGNRLTLRVECGSGTYIRSLVRDLGEALGCGAHVAVLRRLWVQPFLTPRMYTLEQLEAMAAEGEPVLDACLLPVQAGLVDFPRVELSAADSRRFGLGQRLSVPQAPDGVVAVYNEEGLCLGLGQSQPSRGLAPQRLFSWAVVRGQAEQDAGKN